MKLWIDDVRPAPEGYVWCKSVNEAKNLIIEHETGLIDIREQIRYLDKIGNHEDADHLHMVAANSTIKVLDIDHDAGDYASDGGDYIRLLDWLEETGRNYPIRIHSMNVVGVQNMLAICRRNGWTVVP